MATVRFSNLHMKSGLFLSPSCNLSHFGLRFGLSSSSSQLHLLCTMMRHRKPFEDLWKVSRPAPLFLISVMMQTTDLKFVAQMTFRLALFSNNEAQIYRFNSTTIQSSLIKSRDCLEPAGLCFSPDATAVVIAERDQLTILKSTGVESPIQNEQHTISIKEKISFMGFGKKSSRYLYLGLKQTGGLLIMDRKDGKMTKITVRI